LGRQPYTGFLPHILKSQPKQLSKISAAAEKKIEIANRTWGKAKETVLDVYKQLLKDGWTPIEAGNICRERLTIFAPSTLREILPAESKHQNMKRLPSPRKESETEEQQISGSQDGQLTVTQLKEKDSQELIAPEVAQFPPGLSSEQKQMLQADPELRQALESLQVNPNPPSRGHSNKRQQQIEEEEPQEIYQIPPEQYSIQDLAKYDFNKRGEIIVYLHKENKRLRTRIAEFLSVVSLPVVASYDEAREYTRSQGITSRSQWREHTRSDKFPKIFLSVQTRSIQIKVGAVGQRSLVREVNRSRWSVTNCFGTNC
jgi:hypothetical protein